MLTWEPSQRTRGLLSGAHLRSASKIKKIRLAQGLVDPATNREKKVAQGVEGFKPWSSEQEAPTFPSPHNNVCFYASGIKYFIHMYHML